MSSAYAAKQSEKARNKITNYGVADGKLVVLNEGDETPPGFTLLTAKHGDVTIDIPAPKVAPNREQDLFVQGRDYVPGANKFRGAFTKTQLTNYFTSPPEQGGLGLAPMSKELGEAMNNIVLVGSGEVNPSGTIMNFTYDKDLFKQDPDEVKAAVDIGAAEQGYQIVSDSGSTFFPDMPSAKEEIEALQNSGQTFTVTGAIRQKKSQGGETFEEITAVGGDKTQEALRIALGVRDADDSSVVSFSYIQDGKPKTFVPDRKSLDFFDISITDFAAMASVDPSIYGTMSPEDLRSLYASYFDVIDRKETMFDPAGRKLSNPKMIAKSFPKKYPNFFEAGMNFETEEDSLGRKSFRRYFLARVRQKEEEAIKMANKKAGALNDDSGASFTASIPGNKNERVIIPLNLNGDEGTQNARKVVSEFLRTESSVNIQDESQIRDLIGNAILQLPSEDDPDILEVAEDQYTITKLAKFAQAPSQGSAPNYLANASRAFDSTIDNFSPNEDELRAVARAMLSARHSGQETSSFNDRMVYASVFTPQIGTGGSAEAEYDLFEFKSGALAGKDFDNMQLEQNNVSRASMEAARLIAESMALLFIVQEDGTIRPAVFGQAIGEGVLTLSNILSNAKAGVGLMFEKFGLGTLNSDGSPNRLVGLVQKTFRETSDVVSRLEGNPGDAANIIATQFGSTAYLPASKSMTVQVAQTDEAFAKAEAEARKENTAGLNEIIAGLNSGNEAKINVAKRRYLNYIIAYQVASAMQGGTGGRTISDQDVRNVLNFLQPKLSTPDEEYATLGILLKDMVYRGQKGAALSDKTNAQRVFTALVVNDLETRAGYDINSMLQDKIRFKMRGKQNINKKPTPGSDVKPEEGTIYSTTNKGAPVEGAEVVPSNLVDPFLTYLNKVASSEGEDVRFESIDDVMSPTEKLPPRFSGAGLNTLISKFMKRRKQAGN